MGRPEGHLLLGFPMSYDGQRTKLTNFDKTASQICILGAAGILVVRFFIGGVAESVYRPNIGTMPGITELALSPFFAISAAMLMLFLAYFGTRMRRLYDNKTASNMLFVGIMTSIGANFLLLWALFAPAGGSLLQLGQ